MTIRIRKTSQAIPGGPGAVGIRFDPSDSQLKIHDGSSEIVLVTSAAAIPTTDPEDSATIWSDEGVLKVASAG